MLMRYLAACFGLLLPALFHLLPFDRFGELPYNDYYGVIATISHDDGRLSSDPMAWIRLKSNEHSVLLPGLIYAANIALFDGDNRGLSAVALVFLALTFACVWSCLPRAWRESPSSCFLTALAVAWFVFTPVTSHNVVMGFSGVMWFLANVFATLSFFCLWKASRNSQATWAWLLVPIGLLAALTYSTHLAMWPALGIGWLLLGADRRTLPPLLLGATLAIGTHLALRAEVGDPASSLVEIPVFLLGYLGLPYSRDLVVARSLGTLALLSAGVLSWRATRASAERKQRMAPWVMLAVFGISAGLGTATARAGNPETATSTRYATLAAFVWLGLVVGWLLLSETTWVQSRKKNRTVAVFVLTAAVVALPTYLQGRRLMNARLLRADAQAEATLALRLGIDHRKSLSPLSPWTDHVLASRAFLQASGHVPFDRPDLRGTSATELGLRIDPKAEAMPRTRVHLERIQRRSDGSLRLSGWARDPVEGVLLLDRDLTLRGETALGIAVSGIPRNDPERRPWVALLERPCQSRKLPLLYARQGQVLRPVALDRQQKRRLRKLRSKICRPADPVKPRPKPRSEGPDDAG